eukprot:6176066-Pleurochrysis_carterae.AAC.2
MAFETVFTESELDPNNAVRAPRGCRAVPGAAVHIGLSLKFIPTSELPMRRKLVGSRGSWQTWLLSLQFRMRVRSFSLRLKNGKRISANRRTQEKPRFSHKG